MTNYELWLKKTQESRSRWILDEVSYHNKGEVLAHKGGTDGVFITVRNNVLGVGMYEGAIPHIGEACFKVTAKKTFSSNNEAIKRAIEAGGLSFLLDLIKPS